ncbi:MAG TPA: TetR/AcrR family transcriptional regulator [Solirubrobacteraceae bacterium]|nr:TetR/AcrR family transcriptional regulator [Solirubrobacteraceae bacterium]
MATRTEAESGRRPPGETATRILDIAEELVQVRGFNGFSYADVARRLKITNASLHYHFHAKADLGSALVERYRRRFIESLGAIDHEAGRADARLAAYVRLYADVFRSQRMCLCGMLAAEYQTLPAGMQELIVDFFDENESWLARVLEEGASEGSLALDGPPRERARALIGGLEGAMLVARPYDDVERFSAIASQLTSGLAARADGSGAAATAMDEFSRRA